MAELIELTKEYAAAELSYDDSFKDLERARSRLKTAQEEFRGAQETHALRWLEFEAAKEALEKAKG